MAAVTFAPNVLVREFAAAASDSTFLAPLNFSVVREYETQLKAASYIPPEGAGFPTPVAVVAEAASASADGAALPMHAHVPREGGRVFPPAALRTLPMSPQGGAGGAAAAPQQRLQLQLQLQPQQFFQQPQPYLQLQQPVQLLQPVLLQQPTLIDNWYVKPDGHIYRDQGREHSDKITNVHCRQVLTRKNRFYSLGRLDPAVAHVLAVVAPHWNAEDPLGPHTQRELMYAEFVAYGAGAAPVVQLLGSLRAAEAAMGLGGYAELLAPHWQALRQILHKLGMYQ